MSRFGVLLRGTYFLVSVGVNRVGHESMEPKCTNSGLAMIPTHSCGPRELGTLSSVPFKGLPRSEPPGDGFLLTQSAGKLMTPETAAPMPPLLPTDLNKILDTGPTASIGRGGSLSWWPMTGAGRW